MMKSFILNDEDLRWSRIKTVKMRKYHILASFQLFSYYLQTCSYNKGINLLTITKAMI